jgi:hypothetical protein
MDDLLSFVLDFDRDFKHADCDKDFDGSTTSGSQWKSNRIRAHSNSLNL